MEIAARTENTIVLTEGDKKYIVVGTAHILQESKEEVEALIESENPDTVCVELCKSRYDSLKDKDKWRKLDIIKVIREGKAFLLFANMVLTSFQKRFGEDLKSAPGEEMIAALKLAEEKNKNVVLADRDVNVTLKRAWKLSSLMDKSRIFALLLESLFSKEELSKEDLMEMMQGQDVMTEMMNAFADKLPKAKVALIDERNEYLAKRISEAAGNTIIAVVGKGHLEGIAEIMVKKPAYNESIEQVPPPGKGGKIFAWVLGAIIIGLIVWGFTMGIDKGINILWVWFLASGVPTALFALAVLAHPLTILSAFVAPGIKIIVPTISAGMIMAPLEAILRKPQVRDFESLNKDILTLKGFIKNRVTKILLVFVASTFGAIIGHTIALIWIANILAAK